MRPSEVPESLRDDIPTYEGLETSELEQVRGELHAVAVDNLLRYNLVNRLIRERQDG